MSLVPTPARLTLLHGCDQWHSSRVSTASYCYHRKLCRNTVKATGEKSVFRFVDVAGTVRVFRQKFTLEDAIGPHASSLEASRLVTNGIPLGCPRFLPVHTVNCVQTLKAQDKGMGLVRFTWNLQTKHSASW
jgi:hypothetical protein